MSDREKEIQNRLESQREIWAETVRSAADRLSGAIGPSADEVAWLSSVVGQLAVQASEYSELRGKLTKERAKAG